MNNNKPNKFYKFSLPQGHYGCGKSSDITIYVAAPDFLSAMDKARQFPSVKHHRIALSGQEITLEEYLENKRSGYNAYHNKGSEAICGR